MFLIDDDENLTRLRRTLVFEKKTVDELLPDWFHTFQIAQYLWISPEDAQDLDEDVRQRALLAREAEKQVMKSLLEKHGC